MKRGLGGLLAFWAFLVLAAGARAQAPDALTYDADDASCPSAAEAQAQLRAALRDAPTGELPAIASSITIHHAEDAFVATVVLREAGVEEHRSLRDADCRVVARAAILVVAVALFPELVPPPDAPPEPPAADAGPGEAAEPEDVASSGPTEIQLHGSLWLAAHGSLGVLPGLAVGAELAGSLALDALRIDLAVRGLPFVAARFEAAPSLGANVSELVGLLRARGAWAVASQLELGAGGGVEGGAVLGTGVGITDPRQSNAPWIAIEASARLAWVPWRELAMFLEIEALVPVVRPVLTVGGLGVLFRPEPVAGALRVGVEVRGP